MKLLIDAGNTRLKWAFWDGQTISGFSFCTYEELETGQLAIQPEKTVIDAVYLLAVSSAENQRTVINAVEKGLGVSPVQLQTQQGLGSVKNGYRCPGQLGPDRWAGIVGAYGVCGGPYCVVSCGTAVTIDAVDGAGQHLGGYILPGMRLQRRLVGEGTAQVQANGEVSTEGWGCDTASAVFRGSLEAIAGAIERSRDQLEQELGESACVVLTGGDADSVEALLRCDVRRVDDLVFKGMARMISGERE